MDPETGAIALQIAEIASHSQPKSTLARKLAQLLLPEVNADSIAFFWRQQAEHPFARPRASASVRLHLIAALSSQGTPPPMLERSMKMTAYRALSQHAVVDRELPCGASSAETGRLIAIPLGSPQPWIICTAWWTGASAAAGAAGPSLLMQLCHSLTAATMPAHLLDVSRRAEYEQAERRAIFAATSEAILSIGSDYTIIESNPAFLRMLGWQDHSPVDLKCLEVLHCRDSHRTVLCGTVQCPLRQVLSGDMAPAVQELYWETSSGSLREVSASFTPHRIRDMQTAVVVARDDTLLNAANRMKSNFISMVSHELRTPLNSINGFIEIVAEEQVGPLNARQKEFLGYVRTSALQLSALVEDILLITKADSGQFSLRPSEIDVGSLLRQTLQSVGQAAVKAEVAMSVNVAKDVPLVRGDELRVQQVLTNLLNNAIKFSPSEAEITISVRVSSGSAAEFAIHDCGPGVAPEEQARIFERFYQSESSQRARSGGYGLGLAIAKLIVEQHGGEIWLESTPETGTTFYFTLPVVESAAKDLASSESPE